MGQQQGGLAGLHGEGGPHTPFLLHGALLRGVGGGGGGFYVHRNHKAYWGSDNNREALLAYMEKVGPTHPSFAFFLHGALRGGGGGGNLCILRNHKTYWNDIYILRNHKAYWGWGTGGDLYVHRNQRRIGDGGQWVTLHPQKP